MILTECTDAPLWVLVCGKDGTLGQQFLSILHLPSWGHLLSGNIFIPKLKQFGCILRQKIAVGKPQIY